MADSVAILGVYGIARPRFEGKHPIIGHVAFPSLRQSKVDSFRSWRHIKPDEACAAEVRDLDLHSVPSDKWTVPHSKTGARLRFHFRRLVAGASRADQVSVFRDCDANDLARRPPDPVSIPFDLDDIAVQHVFGTTNRHLRLILKRPGSRCRSEGERDNDSYYDADVTHGAILLARGYLAESADTMFSAVVARLDSLRCETLLTDRNRMPKSNQINRRSDH